MFVSLFTSIFQLFAFLVAPSSSRSDHAISGTIAQAIATARTLKEIDCKATAGNCRNGTTITG